MSTFNGSRHYMDSTNNMPPVATTYFVCSSIFLIIIIILIREIYLIWICLAYFSLYYSFLIN
jgi:hypothetical protein